MNAGLDVDALRGARQEMVEAQLRGRGIEDPRVLQAMAQVPRHAFVAEEFRQQAYEDHPIPIGSAQTVSQPFIVALMLSALKLKPQDSVLEIGTGSGYQTALLAELVHHVYSVERLPELAHGAEAMLRQLEYHNFTIVIGDGSRGLPELAPFDAIIVSAAAPQIPAPLFGQLREGGRLLLPVGPSEAQQLQLVQKIHDQPVVTLLEGCRFVPLIGEEGYRP